MIEYHIAEFEIIDGYYYYDQGRNNTINHVIEYLYSLRLKLKKDKSPARMVIKLLMNSMYGKTMFKPVETDTIVKYNKDDFGKYVSYNYNYIDSVIKVNGTYYIKKEKKQIYRNIIMCIVVSRF